MNGEQKVLMFSSELRDIQTINSSFDRGILRTAYWGANRNRTYISKQAFVDALPTIYNCPIVCHYDRDSDSIGGHDMEIVKSNGELRLVNLTTPVGVVPESSAAFWENVTEDDGTVHEYLCMPILLWRRQEAYAHIKENGVTGQSMEIKVMESHRNPDDGLLHIDKFEFTALCIIEVTPCFESASIEVFSRDDFETRLAAMMADFKKEFSKVTAAVADDIGASEGAENFSKGGSDPMDLNELMLKYGLTEQDIDFEITGMSTEELEERFAEIKAGKDAPENVVFDDENDEEQADAAEDQPDEGEIEDEESGSDESQEGETDGSDDSNESEHEECDDDDDDVKKRRNKFSLTGEQFVSELVERLCEITYEHPEWGQLMRYGYVDYDPEASEVYVYDYTDWKLYGFVYSMNGDNVVLNMDSKKRKKFAFVDFDMGSAMFCYKHMFDGIIAQYQKVDEELSLLRSFKIQTEQKERKTQEDKLFDRFADLAGNEAFETLKQNSATYSMNDLEDKCYAIRGRNMEVKFSLDSVQNSTRVPADTHSRADEPYGGVFLRYGIGSER